MIAAISGGISVPEAAGKPGRHVTNSHTGWAYQPLPNLIDTVRKSLGKVRAGWTFTTICTELGYACHKKRASWENQRLGIGLRAIARESGQSVAKVRRDVEALEGLGLVVVIRPVMVTVRNANGVMVSKSKAGRVENTVIYLTITPDHLRPSKDDVRSQDGTRDGATAIPSPRPRKDHGGTTLREDFKEIQRRPDGDAVGIGTPSASEEGGLGAAGAGRLPAAQAGRHPPAQASQEGIVIVPANAGRDEPERLLPSPNRPRATPAPKARPATPIKSGKRTNPYQEQPQEPQTWSGAAEEARLRMLRQLDEDRRRADEAVPGWRARPKAV